MEKTLKFLRRQNRLFRKKLEDISALIKDNRLAGLDITPLQGQKDYFRCRVGDVRIIFYRHHGKNTIIDIGYRGGMYRKK